MDVLLTSWSIDWLLTSSTTLTLGRILPLVESLERPPELPWGL